MPTIDDPVRYVARAICAAANSTWPEEDHCLLPVGEECPMCMIEAQKALHKITPATVKGIPDFGEIHTEFVDLQGYRVPMSWRAVVPNTSMQDLVRAYQAAKDEANPEDSLSGNPSKWPTVRGINAVLDTILSAIYETKK